jgi:MoaA/NifB/PqqE/SkfB family radical SAM enzyme
MIRPMDFLFFAKFWVKAVFLKKKEPIIGSVILTDRCNLKCKHCSVNNITTIMHPYSQIKADMQTLYGKGVRILFLYGGEPFLWKDGELTIRNLVVEAKRIGFVLVNLVTNGTFPIDVPEADLIMVSLDGDKERHDALRGNTYDTIMENVRNATTNNICFYMAINKINKDAVRDVCMIAKKTPNVKAVSFNFHTPYPDTRDLLLSKEEKKAVCHTLSQMMDEGAPVFNLKGAFPYLINNSFPTPCHQSLIIENGKISVCGRCIDEPGLCNECGYFFVAEYTLLFKGNLKITLEALKTYLKYI